MPSQQQQAPPPQESETERPTETVRGYEGDKLSIAEMTRIMDVASTLRRERSVAQKELHIDETKRMLRERLLETARVTGDPVTAEEIDAAIEHYFETQHKFEPPKASMETFLAHLYVLRNKIAMTAAVLGGGLALWWTMFGFGLMPRGRGTRSIGGIFRW